MKKDFKNSFVNYSLNIAIILLGILCAYLAFSLFSSSFSSKDNIEPTTADTTKKNITKQPGQLIQLDVQNGTGINGIASVFSDYLRKFGFDVVEMGNYKSDDVSKTKILSRKEDLTNAEKIAIALGVNKKYVTQQINPSLFIDATVVIGKDFKELKPFTEKEK